MPLFRNILITFCREVVNILCLFLFWILLARGLGPEGTGTFAIVILLPSLLTNLLNFGVPFANVYHVARGELSVSACLIRTILAWAVISVLGLTGSAALIEGFAEAGFPGAPKALLWVATAIFPIALLHAYLASILQAVQDFRRFNIVHVLPAIVSLGAAASILWLNLGVSGALLAWGLGYLSATILALWFLSPRLSEGGRAGGVTSLTRQWLAYGWKTHAASVLAFVNYRADIFLVNLFLGPLGAGIYAVAVQIAERLWLLSYAAAQVLLPRLSQLHTDEVQRQCLTPIIARWVGYVALVVALVLSAIVEPLVRFLFGIEYLDAARVLLWFLPGIVVLSCARVLAHDITARGHPGLNAWTGLMTVATNIALNLILIPRFGLVGAAAATSIAYAVAAFASFLFYARLSRNHWWRPLVFERDDWHRVCRLFTAFTAARTGHSPEGT